jgi:hypothetical protein
MVPKRDRYGPPKQSGARQKKRGRAGCATRGPDLPTRLLKGVDRIRKSRAVYHGDDSVGGVSRADAACPSLLVSPGCDEIECDGSARSWFVYFSGLEPRGARRAGLANQRCGLCYPLPRLASLSEPSYSLVKNLHHAVSSTPNADGQCQLRVCAQMSFWSRVSTPMNC